ncbi:hypothetical protein [Zobellia alginiliquefaciens]|uniref:hypothetical protein n=1 Tax=Zobellia alginiliquefaciens TaxID=3032586 RepID=UPI0023E3C0DD|nr:hypothetical protein [Zobellia alginiliquefaciens]
MYSYRRNPSIYLFFLIVVLPYISVVAQTKNEKEYRISKENFPEAALSQLENKLSSAKRIRYFKEYDNTQIGYEVKFKLKKVYHSVEFDSIGQLEDIETYIEEKDIPEPILQKVNNYLDEEFNTYRIIKIQRQYTLEITNAPETLFQHAFNKDKNIGENYEIVIAGRNQGDFENFELLFSPEGTLINKRKFTSIGYDHILY